MVTRKEVVDILSVLSPEDILKINTWVKQEFVHWLPSDTDVHGEAANTSAHSVAAARAKRFTELVYEGRFKMWEGYWAERKKFEALSDDLLTVVQRISNGNYE